MSKYLAISKSHLVLPTMEKPENKEFCQFEFENDYKRRYDDHVFSLPRYESNIELVPNQYYTEGVDFKWKPWFDKFDDGKRAVPLPAVAQPGKEVEGKRITLCGSTKFKKQFEAINKQLTLEGHLVYSVSSFGHADNIPWTKEQKDILDAVHKKKIDNSDAIFVIDVDRYIGESTRSEIEHALYHGKIVKYLSKFPDLLTIAESAAMPDHLPSPGKQEPKRMSAFEHAILNQVDPEEAKKYKPYTKEEELEQRENHLKEQASKIRVNTGKQEGEGKEHDYKSDWEYHCKVSGGHTYATFLELLLDDPEFYSIWCSKEYPQPPATQDSAEGKRFATGCKTFTGGEKKHIAECPFYPGSLSEQYDKVLPAQQIAADAWDACRNYIEYGIAGGYKDKETYLASLPPHAESYSREFVEGAVEWLYNSGNRRNDGYWWNVSPTGTPIELTTPDLLTSYIKSLNK